MIDPLSYYRNKKNQNKYQVVGFSRNCTNDRDGQILVRYIPVPWNGDDNEYYSREIKEFEEKFEKCQR